MVDLGEKVWLMWEKSHTLRLEESLQVASNPTFTTPDEKNRFSSHCNIFGGRERERVYVKKLLCGGDMEQCSSESVRERERMEGFVSYSYWWDGKVHARDGMAFYSYIVKSVWSEGLVPG